MQTIDNDLSHKLGAQSDTQIYLKLDLIVYKALHYMWHIFSIELMLNLII